MAYVLTGGLGRYRGMGVTTQQAAASGSGAAAGAFQIAESPTVGGKISGAGSLIMAASVFAGPAAPIVAIAGGVVMVAGQIMSMIGLGDGCGQTCVQTSQWANQASAQLDALMAAYFGSPIRNQSTQAEALAAFDAIWAKLQQVCGQAGTGQAGVNCIADRQRGACKWKALPPKWPGEPDAGACWNWFNAYRDPIANDTEVVPDSMIDMGAVASSVSGSIESLFTNADGSTSMLPLLVLGGLALWAVTS